MPKWGGDATSRFPLCSVVDLRNINSGRAGRSSVAAEIETAVVALAIEQPTWGQVRVSNELKKQGLSISPFGVRAVWLRHDLANTKRRLKALEALQERTLSGHARMSATCPRTEHAARALKRPHCRWRSGRT
jgi:hypothetical protein